MKNLYTIALCLFATLTFGQDTTKTSVKKHGFWVAASYGYNFRGPMADFHQYKAYPATYAPKAYFAGHMPTIEVGCLFANRLGLYLGFSIPFAIKHEYHVSHEYQTFTIEGHDNAKGWYGSLGAQFYVLNKAINIKPYIKAAFNVGSAQIDYFYSSNSSVNYKYRGGYILGGTIALGAEYKTCKRLYLFTEAAFTNMVYKPKERTGKEYNTDLSDLYTPGFPWMGNSQYLLQEYFRMNFISARVGLKYNLFGN